MPVAPPVFRPPGQRNRREVRIEQDQRRGSARERGYTTQWDHAARAHRQAHPLCVGCYEADKVRAATLVDHIIPHKGDQTLFWDRTNWQSACDHCGNAIKQQLERMHEQGLIEANELRLTSATAQELIKNA